MTLEDLGNLGDFIGGLAVIATLLYLAVQVRQNTQLLRANALTTSSAANVSFNHMLGSDPAVARVFQLGLEDFTSLREEEQRQFLSLLRGLFTAHAHVFEQYEHGLVTEEVWHQNRRMALGVLALPHIRVWWEHRRDVFVASFAKAIDEASESSPAKSAGDVIAEMIARAASAKL